MDAELGMLATDPKPPNAALKCGFNDFPGQSVQHAKSILPDTVVPSPPCYRKIRPVCS